MDFVVYVFGGALPRDNHWTKADGLVWHQPNADAWPNLAEPGTSPICGEVQVAHQSLRAGRAQLPWEHHGREELLLTMAC